MPFPISRRLLLSAAAALATAPGPAAGAAPPPDAPGFPSRDPNLDVLPGFRHPPPGYGEVPFWWWTGDPLDTERLIWQLEELHRKGISGVQVNYAHQDTPGWPTYPAEPEVFSERWWEVWKTLAGEAGRRGMGIGLSGYTLDWPNGRSLVSRTVYSDPEIQGRELAVETKARAAAGARVTLDLPADTVAVRAYPAGDTAALPSIDLDGFTNAGRLAWTPRQGDWEIRVYTAPRKPGTLNPIHPLAGRRVVERFFQPFEDHAPGRSHAGLNYFFQDELRFGVGDRAWVDDLPAEFRRRKGYDLFDALPAMFDGSGPMAAKHRLDFMDVRTRLAEERYFIPIFEWHSGRGRIYGCDPGSRGRNPVEFGDYFAAVRWYTAPGHDTPGGKADLIKGKVSSSIAHLYRRPRVWLEGYHSLGWGATPENLMYATRENYLYGCNLLNLHGLYYTTHGSFWEWAPPCYHFRMPYWEHMGTFLKYFERLSYLMSQGVHQAEVAILYPVAPGQARLGGKEAAEAAFAAGRTLFGSGHDFIFLDADSLDRAVIRGARLEVSDASYGVLVLPGMRAIRWSNLAKALEFQRAGGAVFAIGGLPEASDRAGANDPQLDAAVRELFGAGSAFATPEALTAAVAALGPRAVESAAPVRATRRKAGARDVYLTMGAPKGSECTFRSTGRAEIWDPWTGRADPLVVLGRTAGSTTVRMPLAEYEAQVVVFTPDPAALAAPAVVTGAPLPAPAPLTLDGEWEFELKPTMNNRWGDFRLPATEPAIGPEARIFRHAEERAASPGWQAAGLNDSAWLNVTHGFGRKFWKLGPLPRGAEVEAQGARLAALQAIDPLVPVGIGGRSYAWTPYSFSWRWGVEGDPGHQGYHGLKENVSPDFIRLGKPKSGLNQTLYVEEEGGTCYFLWTAAVAPRAGQARVVQGGEAKPAAVWLNGARLAKPENGAPLRAGPNPLLLRYDAPGRGHFVLEMAGAAPPAARTPLAMEWYDRPGVLPFDPSPEIASPAGWYRFTAPPGLRGMTLTARGAVQAWADGAPLAVTPVGPHGAHGRRCRVALAQPPARQARIALRIETSRGDYGGEAIPDPVLLDCAAGIATLGDWSKGSALECYSGGAWYRKNVRLSGEQAGCRVTLDLGAVAATAEARINGRPAGVRVAPPWTLDLTGLVRAGENRVEILVYNTLANHYRTVPTRYRGDARSGLLGPVRLEFARPAALRQG